LSSWVQHLSTALTGRTSSH